MVVIVSDKENNSGFWPVIEAVQSTSESNSNTTRGIRIWDSEAGMQRPLSVPGPYKVVHYKDA